MGEKQEIDSTTPKAREALYRFEPMFRARANVVLARLYSRRDDNLTRRVALGLVVFGCAFVVRHGRHLEDVHADEVCMGPHGLRVRPRPLPRKWTGPTEFVFRPGEYLHLQTNAVLPEVVTGGDGKTTLDLAALEYWTEEWSRLRAELDAFRSASEAAL